MIRRPRSDVISVTAAGNSQYRVRIEEGGKRTVHEVTVTPDDVKSLALPTLRHRVVLRAEAEIEGLDADAVVRRVLARLDVPR